MIWAGGCTDLRGFRTGTVDEAIRPLVTSQIRQLHAEFIFIHNSVPYHGANIANR